MGIIFRDDIESFLDRNLITYEVRSELVATAGGARSEITLRLNFTVVDCHFCQQITKNLVDNFNGTSNDDLIISMIWKGIDQTKRLLFGQPTSKYNRVKKLTYLDKLKSDYRKTFCESGEDTLCSAT